MTEYKNYANSQGEHIGSPLHIKRYTLHIDSTR